MAELKPSLEKYYYRSPKYKTYLEQLGITYAYRQRRAAGED